jgi:hypothetical protein
MVTRATIRQWHSYIGVFVAPSVLFFALTGSVQLFSLHEAHGHYEPPAIIEKLSSVHKDQVFALGHHQAPGDVDGAAGMAAAETGNAAAETGTPDAGASRPGSPVGAPPVGAPPPKHDDDEQDSPTTTLLKWFFLIVAVCLTFSTAFGVWMGLTQTRKKSLAWTLLAAGALIPLGLLMA